MSPTRTAPARRPPPGSAGGRRPLIPPIDPRIRHRRAEVARGRRRRRRAVTLSLLALILLAVGTLLLLHSSLFGARAITVEGSVHTAPSQVIAEAGLSGHPPLIDVDPGQTAARIERLPWVRSATVTRHWPDGLTIRISERKPVAVVATADTHHWLVVDAAGRVIEALTQPPPGLVDLTLPALPAKLSGWLAPAAAPALAVAASLPPAFAGQVDDVAANRQGDVTLTLDQSLRVNLGPALDLQEKYEDVAAILAGATLQAGDWIDVTVPGSPSVGPNA